MLSHQLHGLPPPAWRLGSGPGLLEGSPFETEGLTHIQFSTVSSRPKTTGSHHPMSGQRLPLGSHPAAPGKPLPLLASCPTHYRRGLGSTGWQDPPGCALVSEPGPRRTLESQCGMQVSPGEQGEFHPGRLADGTGGGGKPLSLLLVLKQTPRRSSCAGTRSWLGCSEKPPGLWVLQAELWEEGDRACGGLHSGEAVSTEPLAERQGPSSPGLSWAKPS